MNIFQVPWYVSIPYLLVGVLLLWAADKFNIIRPKPLRYFIFIFAYALIGGIIYDLVLTP